MSEVFWSEYMRREGHFEPCLKGWGGERIIVRCILDETDRRLRLDFSPMAYSCVYGNEYLGTLKNEEFCYLRD